MIRHLPIADLAISFPNRMHRFGKDAFLWQLTASKGLSPIWPLKSSESTLPSLLRIPTSVSTSGSAQNYFEHQGLLRSAPASQKWTTAPISTFSDQEPPVDGKPTHTNKCLRQIIIRQPISHLHDRITAEIKIAIATGTEIVTAIATEIVKAVTETTQAVLRVAMVASKEAMAAVRVEAMVVAPVQSQDRSRSPRGKKF
jgi:hypothetical protein